MEDVGVTGASSAMGQVARTERGDARMVTAFVAAFTILQETQPGGAFHNWLGDMFVARENVVDQRAATANPSEIVNTVSANELPAFITM